MRYNVTTTECRGSKTLANKSATAYTEMEYIRNCTKKIKKNIMALHKNKENVAASQRLTALSERTAS